MNHALLLVDIQNDYFPDGKMELSASPEAGENARRLLLAFRKSGLPVVHIQHLSVRPGSSFFLPNTEGVKIHTSVTPIEGEAVFQKNYPNSFRQTPLLDHLRQDGITRLTIAGMMTHMCIDTTVRAAFDLGFDCCLAHDACATKSLSFAGFTVPAGQVQTSFLASLNGLFARVLPTNEICSNL